MDIKYNFWMEIYCPSEAVHTFQSQFHFGPNESPQKVFQRGLSSWAPHFSPFLSDFPHFSSLFPTCTKCEDTLANN